MSEEIILKIGDTVEYAGGRRGVIEKIRVISSGQHLEQYKHDGKGKDIVLTLKGKSSSTSLWLRDAPVHKVIEKEKKE